MTPVTCFAFMVVASGLIALRANAFSTARGRRMARWFCYPIAVGGILLACLMWFL